MHRSQARIFLTALRRARADARVHSIENEGMEEGRVFIHLRPGFGFDLNGCNAPTQSKSVGSGAEILRALSAIVATSTKPD